MIKEALGPDMLDRAAVGPNIPLIERREPFFARSSAANHLDQNCSIEQTKMQKHVVKLQIAISESLDRAPRNILAKTARSRTANELLVHECSIEQVWADSQPRAALGRPRKGFDGEVDVT